jgi:hypothetical protein
MGHKFDNKNTEKKLLPFILCSFSTYVTHHVGLGKPQKSSPDLISLKSRGGWSLRRNPKPFQIT